MIFLTALTVHNLYGQDNCFAKCFENFDKSTVPIPERNHAILQRLVGCQAPMFKVRTINGKPLTLAELQGKVVVINFWFIGCAPCISEMPALNKLVEAYKGKDVVFIAFSRDDHKSLSEFLVKRQFNYEQVSADYELSKEYCILAGWPTNMVLDRQGVVRQIFSGGSTSIEKARTEAYEKMRPTIDKYLLP